MTEFAPKWSNPRMTKAQVKKYISDMKDAQEEAKKRLKEAENSWELELEKIEIEILEKKLEEL